MARVGLGARRLVLEAKQGELVPRLGGGQLLLVARPLLSRVELERALFLVLLVGVRLEAQARALGDGLVVHRLQRVTRLVAAAHHLVQHKAGPLHARRQQREG